MQTYTRRHWLKNNEGTTAIEFAILAIPFYLFLIAIIEVALLLANTSILEGAAQDAARLVRTGNIQQNVADPEEAFLAAICDHAIIMDCNLVQYNVTTLDSFDDAAESAATYDEDGNMEDTGFVVGGSGDIVMIRVSYLYPLMTPLIGRFFSNYPGNRRLLMSTVVLQTEPYEFD
ncbi:MAG: pilus assembly protein [Alphaproteobacteria bacterium]|nr:pilus assembly protein [Alphaproteobacteria bacterium]